MGIPLTPWLQGLALWLQEGEGSEPSAHGTAEGQVWLKDHELKFEVQEQRPFWPRSILRQQGSDSSPEACFGEPVQETAEQSRLCHDPKSKVT